MKKQKPSKRRSRGRNRPAARKRSQARSGSGRPSARQEWVGGRFPAPMYVNEQDPYRPVLELWVADDYIVDFAIYDPNESIPAVSDTLRQKLLDPPFGARPGRLRLNDPEWAAAVRRALPQLDVVAGPTPELEDPLDHLIASMEADAGPATYFAGDASPEDLAALFGAAAALYRAAPWEILDDDQLIEVDIPELDVSGACLSIIGALGESFGLLVFDSLTDFERMLDAGEELEATGQIGELDFTMTSLNYERGADLPDTMRREVQRHGWPVAAAAAYPVVDRRDGDDLARTVTHRELRIITACAEAMVALLEQDPDAFVDREKQLALSHVDRSGVTVHLRTPPTALIEAYGEERGAHGLDNALLLRIFEYAHARWGQRFIDRLQRLFRGEFEEQLTLQMGAYHLDVEGSTLAEHFLKDPANELDEAERRWLEAQRSAWLSLWEVTAVHPGEGIELHDLLTDETRRVTDKQASENLTERSVLLARVVEGDGRWLLSGSHPLVLSPLAANEVAERMRKYLRRKSAVAPERLREPNTARHLIRCWLDEIDEIEDAQTMAPELRNTDGDRIVGTVDRYTFDESERRHIERALLEIDGLEAEGPGRFVVLREHRGRPTVIGSIQMQKQALRVETNSVERADALRERVQRACAGLLTHRGRSHEDPLVAMDRQALPPARPDDIPAEQVDMVIQAHKQQHYEDWLDEPIPALGNKTPREAARTKSGRPRLEALISEIEYHEASLPPGQRFDVSVLRRALKL